MFRKAVAEKATRGRAADPIVSNHKMSFEHRTQFKGKIQGVFNILQLGEKVSWYKVTS